MTTDLSPLVPEVAEGPQNPFKTAREAMGLTQVKAAAGADVALPTLARIENANGYVDYKTFRLSTLNKLAQFLGLPETQVWLGDKVRLV